MLNGFQIFLYIKIKYLQNVHCLFTASNVNTSRLYGII
jgi:hypothetical protein